MNEDAVLGQEQLVDGKGHIRVGVGDHLDRPCVGADDGNTLVGEPFAGFSSGNIGDGDLAARSEAGFAGCQVEGLGLADHDPSAMAIVEKVEGVRVLVGGVLVRAEHADHLLAEIGDRLIDGVIVGVLVVVDADEVGALG